MTQDESASQDGSHHLKILIVEDDAAAREASSRYLQLAGYDVASAADADSAEARARQRVPDVLVCDWHLSGNRDGVDVATALQQRYGVHIIFVTAHPIEELKDQTTHLTVLHYLRKPLSLAELLKLLQQANATRAN